MITNATKSQIKYIIANNNWKAVEDYILYYIKNTFDEVTIKRNSEFETLWSAAESEGAKKHIKIILKNLEDIATSSYDN